MKQILKSKWNFIITLSLFTAILLFATMSFAFRSGKVNLLEDNLYRIAKTQQIASRTNYVQKVKKENAAATLEPVVEVAAAPAILEEVQAAEAIVPEEPVYDYTVFEETWNQPDLTAASADYYTAGELKFHGVIYSGGWRWTWYSQNVLPGGGLSIPGRHVDENGFICDENNRICLASEDLAYGTVVATPFGKEGCVYDCGCDYGTLDVYVDF